MEKIHAMIDASKDDLSQKTAGGGKPEPGTGHLADNPIDDEITIDDFAKIDLRVAKIVRAENVEGADKLLQLTLDIGGETRNVFARITSYNVCYTKLLRHAVSTNLRPQIIVAEYNNIRALLCKLSFCKGNKHQQKD